MTQQRNIDPIAEIEDLERVKARQADHIADQRAEIAALEGALQASRDQLAKADKKHADYVRKNGPNSDAHAVEQQKGAYAARGKRITELLDEVRKAMLNHCEYCGGDDSPLDHSGPTLICEVCKERVALTDAQLKAGPNTARELDLLLYAINERNIRAVHPDYRNIYWVIYGLRDSALPLYDLLWDEVESARDVARADEKTTQEDQTK